MAILNSIRKRGVFLIVIIAMALFSFILSDVISNGGFSSEKSATTVATINGDDIPRDDFMKKVETTQRSFGPNGTTAQAMNSVWDRELRSVLQRQEYDKLGLTAQQNQIDIAMESNLASNPTFQDENGFYNTGKVEEYVASIRTNNPSAYQQWVEFEESIKSNAIQTTYYNLIKAGLRSTLSEGEQQYRFENNKINIQYVYIPYATIPDTDVIVSDGEIEKYLRAHEEEFTVEPQVDIQYVSFSEQPTEGDIENARTDIEKLLTDREVYNSNIKANETLQGLRNATDYEAFVNANSDVAFEDRYIFKAEVPQNISDTLFNLNVGDIYGPYKLDNNTYNLTKIIAAKQMPDSVQSKHILIRYEGTFRASDAITRSKEDAQKLADSLNTVINKTPAQFDELAKQYSDDKSNSEKGGDLGSVPPGAMVPAFNDFIFDNKQGTIGVVETDFGFHIVEVGKQTTEQKAIKVATVSKDIEASEGTINDVFGNASKFEVAAQKGDFQEVATAQKFEVKPVNKIGALDANIPGVGNNRAIVNWAFNEESNVGDVKRFSIPEGYVIAQLTRKNPKGLMSIAEASPLVLPKLRNLKKAEKIRANIKSESLQEIAAEQNVQVQDATALTLSAPTIPGAGAEPKVVGAAFGKKAGETTKLINGEKGVFKVRVIEINEAPTLENYSTYANQLNNAVAPTVNTAVFQALKKSADIEDNRAKFF